LLYGFFENKLFDKVTYQLITSECCNKTTFSADDRRFVSHGMSNSRWTAGFTAVMQIEGRISDTICTSALRRVLTRSHFRDEF
jgi:hypothetical protein